MAWAYDNPRFRKEFNSGDFKVDIDQAVTSFFAWLSTDVELTYENSQTGESVKAISPKRGNKQFARKKWKKVQAINEGMKGLQFDFDIPNHRGIYKNCNLILITLTFSHDISMEKAWYLISSRGGELNKFRANLTKILGSKATINVKEAQSNGYPAPHILVLLDKPVKAKKHYGKGGRSWRLESEEVRKRIKDVWTWGHSDIEAVVSSSSGRYKGYRSPVSYLSKYLTKHMDLTKNRELFNARSIKDIPVKMRTPVYTHVWNKILRSRDFYISKAFKERLNNPAFHQDGPNAIETNPWQITDITFKCCLPVANGCEMAHGGIG